MLVAKRSKEDGNIRFRGDLNVNIFTERVKIAVECGMSSIYAAR